MHNLTINAQGSAFGVIAEERSSADIDHVTVHGASELAPEEELHLDLAASEIAFLVDLGHAANA